MAPRSPQRRPETQRTSDAVATLAGFLRRRPLSEREARDRLEEAGFSSEEIDAALDHAREARWVDDKTFARLWVEDRLLHHPLSRRAIEEELRGRKVSRDVISTAVTEHYPEEQEREIATSLAAARLQRLAAVDEATRRRRTIDFLIRRGFTGSLAADSVRRALQGETHD